MVGSGIPRLSASPVISAKLDIDHKASRRSSGSGAVYLAMPATLVVIAVLALPLVLLFRYSLNQYDRYDMMVEAFTLRTTPRSSATLSSATSSLRTIYIAAISTAITLVLAFPVAYFIARAPARWKSLLIILRGVPAAGRQSGARRRLDGGDGKPRVPQPVAHRPSGFIEEPLEILYTPIAVVIGIVAVVLPFMILSLQSVLENIDPSLEEAAEQSRARARSPSFAA